LSIFEKRKIDLRNHKGKKVRHYKDKEYLILDFAIATETEEELVIYKALYDECGVFARPIDMFVSKVSNFENGERWRFELI
jgi:hypothetical protein